VLNLEPATMILANIVKSVGDDQLDVPTPCAGTTLGELLDHVNGFAWVFTAAATKTKLDSGSQASKPDASNLARDWRTRIPDRLTSLGRAWTAASAWEGMTEAGGSDVPAEMAGVIALDEIIVHGWDIAVASGQGYYCEPELVQAAFGFVQATVAQNPDGSPGLFGPPVPVAEDAPLFDRLIGLTGRDPNWRPSVH
jgi:uncharacterized protein (TIGR03086 family)